MDNKSSTNLQKFILATAYLAAAVLVLLVINKIETTPEQIPTAVAPLQPVLQPVLQPSSPTAETASSTLPSKNAAVLEIKEYPKRVAIPLKSWSNIESAKNIITSGGGQILKVLNWPAGNVIVAILPDKNAEQKILKNSFWGKLIGGIGLSSLGNKLSGGIDSVQPDIKIYAQDQTVGWGPKHIGADKVWNADGGSTGKGVKVAVIDTGIQYDHPDLAANVKGGVNIMTGGTSPQDWKDDCVEKWGGIGHGTHVAGDIAAVNNTVGIVGVAPDASIYAVKVGGADCSAQTTDLISGIYWAGKNGMRVANIGFGMYLAPGYWRDQEQAAVDYTYQHGVLLVASSGNYGTRQVIYPSAFTESVIAVSAIDQDNTITEFSSYGPEVELTAPGANILTTVPGSTYGLYSGTSESAPYVTGVAALILEKNPTFTPAQVRERLDSTAVDLGTPGRDEYFGYGLVNALQSINPSALPTAINLISPKGGEQWWEGVKQKVKWSVDIVPTGEKVNKVDIQLIYQRGSTMEALPLALDAANNGDLLVDLPSGLPITSATDNYFLQISCSKEYLGKCQSAKSGLLNIMAVPPQALTVAYPKGGERWPQGTVQSVLWTANYFGGTGVDVNLLEKKQVPTYSFISGSQINTCYDPSNCQSWANGWSGYDPTGVWPVGYSAGSNPVPPPPDTCDGNIKTPAAGGKFSCPATNSSEHLSCTDVAESRSTHKFYWARNVNCSYQSGPPFLDIFVPAKLLAQNVANTGLTEITVPADALGDYIIQLNCSNFTGQCAQGKSASPFSIVRLSDPVTLTVNKLGAGAVTDGNVVCSGANSCQENYERGTAINLTAAPTDPTAIFTGWSGACSGTGTCQVTMGGNQSVTATFSVRAVTLTAVADPGTTFTGWSGACLNNGQCFVSSNGCATAVPCNITMSADQAVNANFIKNPISATPTPTNPTNPGTGGGSGGGSGGSLVQPPAPKFTPGQLKEIKP